MCEIQRQAPAHPNDQRLVTLMSNLRGVKHNCSSIGWKTRSPRRRSRLALPTRCHLNEQSLWGVEQNCSKCWLAAPHGAVRVWRCHRLVTVMSNLGAVKNNFLEWIV